MIIINGFVSDEIKQRLLSGGTHPVARRHANLIIAGGNFANRNLYDPTQNPIEVGAIASANGNNTTVLNRLRTATYIKVKPNTSYTVSTNMNKVYVFEYTDDKTYLKSNGWTNVPYTFKTSEQTENIRIVMITNDNKTVIDDFQWLRIEEVKE